ncbi:MAG: hypothetical protein HY719_15600, partial [Planctomycetes bacterium]|nr:hypothetical protein [Planctomycetota bacterium]
MDFVYVIPCEHCDTMVKVTTKAAPRTRFDVRCPKCRNMTLFDPKQARRPDEIQGQPLVIVPSTADVVAGGNGDGAALAGAGGEAAPAHAPAASPWPTEAPESDASHQAAEHLHARDKTEPMAPPPLPASESAEPAAPVAASDPPASPPPTPAPPSLPPAEGEAPESLKPTERWPRFEDAPTERVRPLSDRVAPPFAAAGVTGFHLASLPRWAKAATGGALVVLLGGLSWGYLANRDLRSQGEANSGRIAEIEYRLGLSGGAGSTAKVSLIEDVAGGADLANDVAVMKQQVAALAAGGGASAAGPAGARWATTDELDALTTVINKTRRGAEATDRRVDEALAPLRAGADQTAREIAFLKSRLGEAQPASAGAALEARVAAIETTVTTAVKEIAAFQTQMESRIDAVDKAAAALRPVAGKVEELETRLAAADTALAGAREATAALATAQKGESTRLEALIAGRIDEFRAAGSAQAVDLAKDAFRLREDLAAEGRRQQGQLADWVEAKQKTLLDAVALMESRLNDESTRSKGEFAALRESAEQRETALRQSTVAALTKVREFASAIRDDAARREEAIEQSAASLRAALETGDRDLAGKLAALDQRDAASAAASSRQEEELARMIHVLGEREAANATAAATVREALAASVKENDTAIRDALDKAAARESAARTALGDRLTQTETALRAAIETGDAALARQADKSASILQEADANLAARVDALLARVDGAAADLATRIDVTAKALADHALSETKERQTLATQVAALGKEVADNLAAVSDELDSAEKAATKTLADHAELEAKERQALAESEKTAREKIAADEAAARQALAEKSAAEIAALDAKMVAADAAFTTRAEAAAKALADHALSETKERQTLAASEQAAREKVAANE